MTPIEQLATTGAVFLVLAIVAVITGAVTYSTPNFYRSWVIPTSFWGSALSGFTAVVFFLLAIWNGGA